MATIIAVDDQADDRELIGHVLRRAGHDVIAYEASLDALAAIRSSPPDVVLCDLLMPDMDGFELVAALRADPETRGQPVVLASAVYNQNELTEVKRHYPRCVFLAKPATPETLLAAVTTALELPPAPVPDPPADFQRLHSATLNRRLLAEVERSRTAESSVVDRARRDAALAELSHLALRGESLEELNGRACALLGAVLAADLVALHEGGLGDSLLRMSTGLGWPAGVVGAASLKRDAHSLAALILSHDEPVVFEDLTDDGRFRPPADLVGHGVRSGVAAVVPNGHQLCLLAAYSTGPRRFSAGEAGFVQSVAVLLGTARVAQRTRLAGERRERQLVALFERSRDALLVVDDDNRCIEANPAACVLLQRAHDELIGMLGEQAIVTEALPRLAQVQPALARAGQDRGEVTVWLPDGTRRELEFTASANVADGLHLIALRDVTERKQLERELLQAQKLEAMGRLAGGVAHDFNNLLQVILGYTESLERRLAGTPEHDDLAAVTAAAERASALTRQLLAFSRKKVVEAVVLDLSAAVRDTTAMLVRMVGDDVVVDTDLDPEPCYVSINPSQLEQVLANLAVNARDAMPRGGRFTIATRLDAAAGDVRLVVSDTGVGMSPDTLERAFEPFYTTKAEGRGTGLGLALVRRIVDQYGGTISAESAPGEGTTFVVRLPASSGLPAGGEADETAEPPQGGSERILLVEDEGVVRELLLLMLEERGYAVTAVDSGPAALAAVTAAGEPFGLIVTDLVMPGMSGLELVEELTRQKVAPCVLFMSGYSQDLGEREAGGAPVEFLLKPFTSDGLARQVRGLLDTAATARG